jgi:digeranylgeranylglycerophospholipid reductase
MTDRYDLAIVGASFAGLTAARRAAERGLRVVVLERKPEPGAQVHTTGILVKEAADLLDPPAHLVRAVPGVRLYAPSLKAIELTSPGYHFLTTDTPGLLRWLAEQATAAGAELRLDAPFDRAETDGGTVRIADHDIEAGFLLGADGAKARVAELFGLGRNDRFLVGLEAEYEGVGGVDGRFLHPFLDSRLAPGYIGWVAPGPHVTQIGLACKRADKPVLAAFIERIGTVFDLSAARVVERRSGLIPCGGCVAPLGRDNVLLVGDAAGMVSPMTAGGIFTALDHAAAIADAIADATAHGQAGKAVEPLAVARASYPRFTFKRWMRRALDLGPPNWLYNVMIGTAPMRWLARLVYFHTKGLKSKRAWREAVGRGGS